MQAHIDGDFLEREEGRNQLGWHLQEPEAEKLMMEALNVNFVDADEVGLSNSSGRAWQP